MGSVFYEVRPLAFVDGGVEYPVTHEIAVTWDPDADGPRILPVGVLLDLRDEGRWLIGSTEYRPRVPEGVPAADGEERILYRVRRESEELW